MAEPEPTPCPWFCHDRGEGMTMSTAESAGHDAVSTSIPAHATGHGWAKDGTLLRVDCERGIGWVATHYDLDLRVIAQVRGSDEEAHRAASRWAQD